MLKNRSRHGKAKNKGDKRMSQDDDSDFQKSVPHEIVSLTENKIGSGAYGAVYEVKVNGMVFAAKIIHDILATSSTGHSSIVAAGATSGNCVVTSFYRELEILSRVHHPNIVQFLGLCQHPEHQVPILIMEKLVTSLHKFLFDHESTEIPFALKQSMLKNITDGLYHLHNHKPQPIIHRDLTATNVLLDSNLLAKISDFGNSRIVPPERFTQMTATPGTVQYMPPEASKGIYGTPLDIFSFGHLCLFVLLQTFPYQLDSPTYPDSHNPDSRRARSEVDRRAKYFELLQGHDQPAQDLLVIIKECLEDEPIRRPTIDDVVDRLKQIQREHKLIESPLLDRFELLKQLETAKEDNKRLRKVLNDARIENKKLHNALSSIHQTTTEIVEKIYSPSAHVDANEPLAHDQDGTQPTAVKCTYNMDYAMTHNPQALVFKDKIYVGGGYSPDKDGRVTILEFDPHTEVWRKLPKCGVKFFGIASIDEQLVTVGGTDLGTDKATNKIFSLNPVDGVAGEWHPFRCTLPRNTSGPCVSSYKNWIIVVGGVSTNNDILSTIDMLNTETYTWSINRSHYFPVKSSKLCSSVVQNTLYVFVHTLNNPGPVSITNMVYSAQLNDLARSNLVWEKMPDAPLAASIPTHFNNHILALGGKNRFDVYLFMEAERKWKKLAENLHVDGNSESIPSYQCACVQVLYK